MASKTKPEARQRSRSSAYVTGAIVALVLAALTGVEYYLGTHYPSAVFLFLISILKSILVLYFFMHVYRLWRPEGSH
jgi:heme/copper-type cytochrome/quinol oxidase subunit 4